MNKFITLALFAICATMAHGQVIVPYGASGIWSNGQQNSGSTSSASASADASSNSNNSNNNGLVAGVPSWVGPSYATVPAPWINAAPIVAGAPVVPQGWVNPIAGPWIQPGYQVGPVGPCGQGVLSF